MIPGICFVVVVERVESKPALFKNRIVRKPKIQRRPFEYYVREWIPPRMFSADVNQMRLAQLFGWNGMPGWPSLAGSGVATSRFTTIGSLPLRTTTASQISSGLALIS
jgi:hypothetical protein